MRKQVQERREDGLLQVLAESPTNGGFMLINYFKLEVLQQKKKPKNPSFLQSVHYSSISGFLLFITRANVLRLPSSSVASAA